MPKKWFFILLIGFFGFTFIPPSVEIPLYATELATANACSIQNSAFKGGEEVTYKVYYNWGIIWLSAGEVVFRVKDEGNQYHFSVVGTTYKSYEWFFKVRDYYDSWVDKKTLLPSVSIRDVHEGKYTLYDKNTFNRRNNTVHNLRGRAIDRLKEDNLFEVEPCLHDMLSIIYYARNLDFEDIDEGDQFPVKLFVDKETWPLNITFEGREKAIKVKGQGYFNALKFSPEVIEGNVFPGDATLHVWATDDNNRIPLIIESPVSVGSVKAILKDYKGLRYDMQARTIK